VTSDVPRRALRLGCALVLAALTLAAATALAERSIEVFRPRHRPAAELLPVAQVALADEGVVALDAGTNALVLAGPPQAVARTLEVLRLQDRARPVVVLTWTSRFADELEAAGVRIDWSIEAGDVRVGTPRAPRGEGVRIEALAQDRSGEGSFAGTLRLLDGEEGEIGTGASAPLVVPRRRGADVVIQSAQSGFRARPRVLGDGRVQVEIMPEQSSLEPGGRVAFTGAATTVTLKPGETVALGGVEASESSTSRGVPEATAARSGTRSRVLLLRAEVESH
jgi:type II secretory pathway component GspD/PulD (secretin)